MPKSLSEAFGNFAEQQDNAADKRADELTALRSENENLRWQIHEMRVAHAAEEQRLAAVIIKNRHDNKLKGTT